MFTRHALSHTTNHTHMRIYIHECSSILQDEIEAVMAERRRKDEALKEAMNAAGGSGESDNTQSADASANTSSAA
jgi:hypothetical protein